MARFLIAIFALVPLAIAPGWLFYFDITPKVVLLLVGAAAAVLVAGRPSPRLGLLIASLTLSTALSAHLGLSLGGSNWRRFGLVTHIAVIVFAWTLARLAASGEVRRDLLRAVTISGCAVALYGIAQYFGVDPWLPRSAYHVGEGEWEIVRPPSTLGHAAYSATWLLFVLFAAVDLRNRDTHRIWRGIAAAAVVLSAVAIVMSGTRAALLAMAVGAAFLLVRGWRPSPRRVAIALAIAGVFIASPAGRGLRSRARWSSEDVFGGARLLLWRDALRMGMEHPLAGFGPETFATEFPRRQSAELANAYPDFFYESPHNVFVEAFVSQGAPGLLIFAALCAMALARSALDPAMGAALLSLLVAQQFTSFTAATALATYLALFLLRGAGTSACRAETRLGASPLSLLLLAAAISLLLADRSLSAIRADLDSGRLDSAIARYSALHRPPGGSPDLWYSRLLLNSSRSIEHAFQAALRATESAEDRHNAWYNLASFHALRNDPAAVEHSLRQSISWAPRWFKPHWTLAQTLQLTGRLDEAEREAVVAADLNAGRNPEVAATLVQIRASRKRN